MLLPIVRARWTSMFMYVFAYASFILFLFGYFPLKYHGGSESQWGDLPDEVDDFKVDGRKLYSSNRTRVILMVVDALRYDFVKSEYMPFTSSLIDTGKACLYKAHAEPPTVTMPRIKAMTTGSVSNFIDVALNFGSSAVTDDSFLNQLKKNGKIAIFYGDDTWLRLFPGIFKRSDGTTSFYVSDYVEVDLNVTRHLADELRPSRTDWDIMILHYLGLDHIGHLEGPSSPKVVPKMIEMDIVIKTIIDLSNKFKDDVVFILTGDHGMKDSGGHGGSSHNEVTVPLVITHKKKCSSKMLQDVDQIDLAPTISYILDVPIPNTSTGQILPQVLSDSVTGDLTSEKSLYALYYNARTNAEALLKTLGEDETINKECFKRYLMAVKQHGEWLRDSKKNPSLAKSASTNYRDSMMNMAHYLTKSLVEFDMYAIFIGIILIGQTLLTQLLLTFVTFKTDDKTGFERSYGYKQNTLISRIVLIICVLVACNFIFKVICGVSQTNSYLCKANPVSVSTIVAMIGIVVTNTVIIQNIKSNSPGSLESASINAIELFLIVCTVIHPLTYIGTSFIEEEHQTWYFFWTSLMVLIFAYTIRVLMDYYKKKSENATETQDKESLSAKMDLTAKKLLPQWLLLMILHRFLRSLNQTGDKWAFLPDTADWLNKDENIMILSLLALAALLSTVIICQKNLQNSVAPYKTNCFLIFGCAICILLYRASTKVIQIPFIGSTTFDEIHTVRLFWFLIFIMVIVEVLSSKRHFTAEFLASQKNHKDDVPRPGEKYPFVDQIKHRQQSDVSDGYFLSLQTGTSLKMKLLTSRSVVILNVMILICSLYLRPHNLMLVPSICATSKLVNIVIDFELDTNRSTIKSNLLKKSILYKTLVHFWIGSVFYFYQGNSNSLASVDLSSGYIGLQSYIPVIVALQMGIHTYAGPILAGMLLFTNIMQRNKDWDMFTKQLQESLSVFTCLKIYIVNVYMIICSFFRYHLFVWTVFSPKLLYDFTSMFFSLFVMSVVAFLCISISIQEKIFLKHVNKRESKVNT